MNRWMKHGTDWVYLMNSGFQWSATRPNSLGDLSVGWECNGDRLKKITHFTCLNNCFNPFTPEGDEVQTSPAASPVIIHHTLWRTWLFTALLRWNAIVLPNSHCITYTFLYKRLGEYTFWDSGSERVKKEPIEELHTSLFCSQENIVAWNIFKHLYFIIQLNSPKSPSVCHQWREEGHRYSKKRRIPSRFCQCCVVSWLTKPSAWSKDQMLPGSFRLGQRYIQEWSMSLWIISSNFICCLLLIHSLLLCLNTAADVDQTNTWPYWSINNIHLAPIDLFRFNNMLPMLASTDKTLEFGCFFGKRKRGLIGILCTLRSFFCLQKPNDTIRIKQNISRKSRSVGRNYRRILHGGANIWILFSSGEENIVSTTRK